MQTIPTISKAAYQEALDQSAQEDLEQFTKEQQVLFAVAVNAHEEEFLSSAAIFCFLLKKQMEADAQS